MSATLAFDVYGTLIDTHGVIKALASMAEVGDQAAAFSQTWRDKQLEYSFRRGLMQNYAPFSVCTRDALEYTCGFYQVSLSEQQQAELLTCYRTLPAFADVKPALEALTSAGHRIYAFSNGTAEAVEMLLQSAGLRDYFLGVVSVDDLRSFKPNPAVYAHFLRTAKVQAGDAWLISSNPFDVIGARSAGMKAAWVQRAPTMQFDPWGIEPTVTISGLADLSAQV